MKSLSPAERREALKAFSDHDAATELRILDRSTLERAANCPWAAKAVREKRCRTVGVAAVSGEEAHKAFGTALLEWIDSHGAMSKADLVNSVECAVTASRPDVQPEAMRAIQPALWTWAGLVYSIHPANILAFDGGEEIGRGGQFAYDFPDLGFRYTGEGDFLFQGDQPECGEYVDWKTGWACHTAEAIRDSFQFQSYAVMILEKYPGWKALRVRVFDTRSRVLSYAVYFPRDRLHFFKVRIRGAYEAWRLSQEENPPTWPTLEKCGICPAAALCPVADEAIGSLAGDPPGFVKRLVAVEARADAMRKLAAEWVDANGQDIQAGGVWFGRRKPASTRKPVATLYELESR